MWPIATAMFESLRQLLWPEGYETAADSVRARSLVVVCAVVAISALTVRLLLYQAAPVEEELGMTVMTVLMVSCLLYPVLLYKTRQLWLVCFVFLLHSSASVIWRLIDTGGLLQPATYFIAPIIVAAFYFVGRYAGAAFSCLFVLFTTMYFINPEWNVLPPGASLEEAKSDITRAYGSINIGIAIISVMVVFLISEFNNATRALEHANAAKSQFLATMSHEIRTPIHGVLGMADVLAEKDFPAEDKQMLRTIQDSGTALLTILNDILDLSKIEAGRLDLENSPFNLRDCVEDVGMLMAQRARDKGLDLIFDIDSSPCRQLVGDPGRLRQIFTNLVGNALKFTETGQVIVKVDAWTLDEGVMLDVSVIDTGIGIAPEKCRTIFDDFSQADEFTTRTYGGTGLGLSISRRLVTAMGGQLVVVSELGKGSTFSFTVVLPETNPSAAEHHLTRFLDDKTVRLDLLDGPLRAALERFVTRCGMHVVTEAEVAADITIIDTAQQRDQHAKGARLTMLAGRNDPSSENGQGRDLQIPFRGGDLVEQMVDILQLAPTAEPQHQTRVMQDPKGRAGTCRLLVADDSATNRAVLKNMLVDPIYDVSVVCDGAEALELARTQPFDLILMDVSMPVLDGLGATRAIRAHELSTKTSRTPILALTAHAMMSDQMRFLEAGMDACLTKPVRKTVLIEEVTKWLARADHGTTGEEGVNRKEA